MCILDNFYLGKQTNAMKLNVMKIILFSIVTLLLMSCVPRHNILGSTVEYSVPDVKVLLDASVDKLRIRHVRTPSDKCKSGYYDHIEMMGEIGPDSTAAVERLLPQLERCEKPNGNGWIVNAAFLSSGGGRLSDGYKLGEIFKQYQIKTIVTDGQSCASSCAIAFLGGKFRSMHHDAVLLFHAPYIGNGIAIDCSDRGQVKSLEKYYKNMLGAKDGEFLLDRTLSYCSQSSGWTLNSDGAKLFGITTD